MTLKIRKPSDSPYFRQLYASGGNSETTRPKGGGPLGISTRQPRTKDGHGCGCSSDVPEVVPPEIATPLRPTTSASRFAPTPLIIDETHCDSSKVYKQNPTYCTWLNPVLKTCATGSAGRIFFPRVNGAPAAGPIVMFCHGKPPDLLCNLTSNFKFYQGFDYLLSCIAANGMIAVSVEQGHGTSEEARSDRLLAHLSEIKARIAEKGVVLQGNEPLALVGHSNGGEAVAIAAEKIRKGTDNTPFSSVKAVVQLAPSRISPHLYPGQFCEKLLIIQGATDGNVEPNGAIRDYETFFASTLLSGSAKPGSFQSLLWVHGGTHTGLNDADYTKSCQWNDYKADQVFLTVALDESKMLLARSMNFFTGAYVSAFLRMALLNDSRYKPWFTGDVSPTFAPPDTVTENDLAKKISVRALSCSAADAIMICNTISCVTASAGVTVVSVMMNTVADCFHARAGFKISWNLAQNKDANVAFGVSSLPLASLGDRFIEFDVARFVGDTTPCMFKVSVMLPLFNGWYTVKIPAQQKLANAGRSRMVLSTVRIPFAAFPQVTPNTLKTIIVNFGSANVIGSVLISSVRISR